VYIQLYQVALFLNPPAILHDLSVTLEGVTEVLTISGNNPLVTIAGEEIIAIVTLDTLNFQCTATSAPVTYTPVSLPSWVTLSETGLFEGTPPLLASTYLATFTVNNAIGPTYYSLNITVR
jgi:hypothetical protein